MSVLGGVGYDKTTGEDVPVYISAIKPDSVADRCDKIQVGREREREREREGE